jgi:hypothetical protein
MASSTFTGPVTSKNGFISGSGSLVAVSGATTTAVTVTSAAHAGRTVLMSGATSAGTAVTFTQPAATGTGNIYTFAVRTVPSGGGNYVIKVANSTDVVQGHAVMMLATTGTAGSFPTVAASDTITLNGTTTGGNQIGDLVTIQDIDAGYFTVTAISTYSGTAATPFSATV